MATPPKKTRVIKPLDVEAETPDEGAGALEQSGVDTPASEPISPPAPQDAEEHRGKGGSYVGIGGGKRVRLQT